MFRAKLTEDWWKGNQRKTCLPIAFTFKCCYRGSFYRLMELQWLLVAENKSGVKIDGGEIPWSHEPLSLLRRAQKGIMWNGLQICGRVTPTLVTCSPCFQAGRLHFGQACWNFVPLRVPHISGTAWMCRKLSRTPGMTQLLAPSCQKAAAPHRWTEILSKSYVNQRDFRWRLGEPFICLSIPSSFMKLTSVSISNSDKFFILTLWNERLLLLIALKNTWHMYESWAEF